MRELLKQGIEGAKAKVEFGVEFIRGESNVADIFTKPLGKAKYREFKDQLNGNVPLADVDLSCMQTLNDVWDSYV